MNCRSEDTAHCFSVFDEKNLVVSAQAAPKLCYYNLDKVCMCSGSFSCEIIFYFADITK